MNFSQSIKNGVSLILGLLVLTAQTTFSAPIAEHSGHTASDQVLVFVSFSMPPASLAQWFNQAEKIQAPLIIRGLVNQSFQQTEARIHELLTERPGGFVLDPRLFEQYQINQVPAVVVRDTSNSCLPSQSCVYPYDVVYGNVSLEHALQTIAQRGDYATLAQNLLQKMRENGS
jgi:conjugal transfer pilus assembly protein TrbC